MPVAGEGKGVRLRLRKDRRSMDGHPPSDASTRRASGSAFEGQSDRQDGSCPGSHRGDTMSGASPRRRTGSSRILVSAFLVAGCLALTPAPASHITPTAITFTILHADCGPGGTGGDNTFS